MREASIILDLCAGSGAWSEPYVQAGYDVRRITLPENDVLTYLPPPGVHGILAAPPCTHFSFARTTAKTPRDFTGAMGVVHACLRIIWHCRIQGSLRWWVLENPMGYLRQFLGKPAVTFSPSDFGHLYTKRTDLWGYFTEPKKTPILVPHGHVLACGAHRTIPGIPQTARSPASRAITPSGFAAAFMKANP